jgi:hypothetical protein
MNIDSLRLRRFERELAEAPINSPKFAAHILRALAEKFETYDPLADFEKLDPSGQFSAVGDLLMNGKGAELDSEDLAFLRSLGVPRPLLPRTMGTRPRPAGSPVDA